jgi:hypothetical protein
VFRIRSCSNNSSPLNHLSALPHHQNLGKSGFQEFRSGSMWRILTTGRSRLPTFIVRGGQFGVLLHSFNICICEDVSVTNQKRTPAVQEVHRCAE